MGEGLPGWRKRVVICFGLLVATLWLQQWTDLDLLVEHWFYSRAEGWLGRELPAGQFLFYWLPKYGLAVFTLGILIELLLVRQGSAARRRGLRIVLASLLLVPGAAVLLKTWTNMSCPRALAEFGGTLDYVRLFERWPDALRPDQPQHCFPAAHASAGFALMSLVFLARSARARWLTLGLALIAGWIMGLYKMAIGDHFLSDTLVSMFMAWLIIELVAVLDQSLGRTEDDSRAGLVSRSGLAGRGKGVVLDRGSFDP